MSLGRRIARVVLAVLGVLVLAVVVLNWTWGRLPAKPRPIGSFVTVDGVRIHYFERPGPGTPVLLVHGLPGTADDFDAVTPLLAGHRTIAIDRPGYGWSGDGYVSFGRQLSIIHDLLLRLGAPRAVIAGHSYGGTIALGLAERYPRQVAGLVLIDAAAAGMKPSGTDTAQAHLVQFLELPVIRQVADVTFSQLVRTVAADVGDDQAFSPQPVASAHRRRLLEINMTDSNLRAFAAETLHAGAAIAQVDRSLGTIDVPTIVIQGDHDQLVAPRYGARIAARVRGARLEMLRGGHMQPYVHPFAVATAIEDVLARAR